MQRAQLRHRHQLDGHLGGHGQHALGADRDRQQVEARGVQRSATKFDHLALDGERAHAQHVVQGEAVLEAVHAAGVFGDVAADRAGNLARRVGCVVEPVRGRGFGNRQIAHTRLHSRRTRVSIDFQDAVELGHGQQYAVGVRQRAARQPGARATRHHRHLQRVARLQHLRHLRLSFGQDHDQRQLAVERQTVAFVWPRILRPMQHAALRQQREQRRHDLMPIGTARLAQELPRDQQTGARARPNGDYLPFCLGLHRNG